MSPTKGHLRSSKTTASVASYKWRVEISYQVWHCGAASSWFAKKGQLVWRRPLWWGWPNQRFSSASAIAYELEATRTTWAARTWDLIPDHEFSALSSGEGNGWKFTVCSFKNNMPGLPLSETQQTPSARPVQRARGEFRYGHEWVVRRGLAQPTVAA